MGNQKKKKKNLISQSLPIPQVEAFSWGGSAFSAVLSSSRHPLLFSVKGLNLGKSKGLGTSA